MTTITEHDSPQFMMVKSCQMTDDKGDEYYYPKYELVTVNRTASGQVLLGSSGDILEFTDKDILDKFLTTIVPVNFSEDISENYTEEHDSEMRINILETNPSREKLLERMDLVDSPSGIVNLVSVEYGEDEE